MLAGIAIDLEGPVTVYVTGQQILRQASTCSPGEHRSPEFSGARVKGGSVNFLATC